MAKLIKPDLIMMVGTPGSGKSTWIETICKYYPNTNVVSRDKIRFSMISDKDDYFSKETEVFEEFIAQIMKSVKTYDMTIIDATHLNKRGRAKVFNRMRHLLKNVTLRAVVMDTTFQTCLRRNSKRTGRALVPQSAIKNMYASFEMPTKEEGFEQIIIVKEDWKESGNYGTDFHDLGLAFRA